MVVIRSQVLESLVLVAIEDGRLELNPVDGDFVERTQAAAFRQRREGLAYRLSRRRFGLKVQKRVAADAKSLTLRRKMVYRKRGVISAGSHRLFRFARRIDRPGIYLRWARAMLTIYHGLADSRGRIGEILDRLGLH